MRVDRFTERERRFGCPGLNARTLTAVSELTPPLFRTLLSHLNLTVKEDPIVPDERDNEDNDGASINLQPYLDDLLPP